MLTSLASFARATRRGRRPLLQVLQALAHQGWTIARHDPAAQLLDLRPCFAALHAVQFSAAKKGKKPLASAASGPNAIDLGEMQRAMESSIERLQGILGSLRAGRASPGMLDTLKVDVYGERMSLKSIGSVSVRDQQMLVVSAFDPQTLPNMEKAIRESPLQLNPKIEGQEVLVPVPRPTPDRIKAMGKMIKQEGESTRVAVRNARKAVMEQVKKMASEDARRLEEKKVQKLTDEYIMDINSMCEKKEEELKSIQ
ncbi:g6722 [Coccomyxa elongata]